MFGFARPLQLFCFCEIGVELFSFLQGARRFRGFSSPWSSMCCRFAVIPFASFSGWRRSRGWSPSLGSTSGSPFDRFLRPCFDGFGLTAITRGAAGVQLFSSRFPGVAASRAAPVVSFCFSLSGLLVPPVLSLPLVPPVLSLPLVPPVLSLPPLVPPVLSLPLVPPVLPVRSLTSSFLSLQQVSFTALDTDGFAGMCAREIPQCVVRSSYKERTIGYLHSARNPDAGSQDRLMAEAGSEQHLSGIDLLRSDHDVDVTIEVAGEVRIHEE